jgi:hypothetical protein
MNTYEIKVDSAKISIPLENCEILHKELQDQFILYKTNLETGEIDLVKEYTGDTFIKQTEYGTYYKIWIEHQATKIGNSDKFLSILINSKHLGKDYFKGITNETLPKLYENIMSQNIFKCTFDAFKNSRYQDTDVAFDFKCTDEHFQILKQNIKHSTLYPELWTHTSKKNNSGIWTPATPSNIKPRDYATPSKPYIKFYSKEIDFIYKSIDFANYFNLHNEAKDIVRFEATIKNSKHKKLLKISHLKTFNELLNSDLKKIISDIFKRYFEKRKFVKQTEHTPMDKLLIDLTNLAISKGATKNEIYKAFDRTDVSRMSNHNLVSKYHKLYSKNLIKKDVLEANETSKNIFEFLGVSEQLKIDL